MTAVCVRRTGLPLVLAGLAAVGLCGCGAQYLQQGGGSISIAQSGTHPFLLVMKACGNGVATTCALDLTNGSTQVVITALPPDGQAIHLSAGTWTAVSGTMPRQKVPPAGYCRDSEEIGVFCVTGKGEWSLVVWPAGG